MQELVISKPYAYIHEVDSANLSKDNEGAMRVYRNDPTTLHVQIRTHKPITPKGVGKARNMIAGTNLTVEEAIALRTKLNEFIENTVL